MKTINTAAFNAAFAGEMARHNAPGCLGDNGNYVNAIPGSSRKPKTPIEPKTVIAARARYSRAIHEHIENMSV